ncbi:hypothetical protein [Paracoccus homiensis]|uniref:hypothetical protein n=1 Tax=Paracoccus homiensis TaxID=364199 RepID=UPI00398C8B42
MKALFVSAIASLAALPALASDVPPPPGSATPVPEISALEGTAALVALAAIVLLTWERRRRAY